MEYELIYDQTGKVAGIIRNNPDGSTTSFGLNQDNSDFQQFLKWNAEQDVPLDLDSTVPIPIINSISPNDQICFIGQTAIININTDPKLSSIEVELYDRDNKPNTLQIINVPLDNGNGEMEIDISTEMANTVMVVAGIAGSKLEGLYSYISVR